MIQRIQTIYLALAVALCTACLCLPIGRFVNEQGVPTQYTVYDKNAQQFIFDNMETLIAFIREREAEK